METEYIMCRLVDKFGKFFTFVFSDWLTYLLEIQNMYMEK